VNATITTSDWLRFLKDEYLDGLIKEGGASVKFPVPLRENTRDELENGIAEQARQSGYLVAHISSADTKIHMIDQVFFRIAEQIPWKELSRKILSTFSLERYGYTPEGDAPIAQGIADAKNLPFDEVRTEADIWIASNIFKNKKLSRDLRVAMSHLCKAEMYGGPDGETRTEVLVDWLTGRNNAISAVKPYQIYSKVTRSNARHLLESSLRVVRLAGYSGMIVILDIARITVAKNPKDSSIFYTRANMLDAYELLRELIDRIDRMTNCLFIVVPASEFMDEEISGRGYGAYQALLHRVYDEVKDRTLVNPMGTLVRLSGV